MACVPDHVSMIGHVTFHCRDMESARPCRMQLQFWQKISKYKDGKAQERDFGLARGLVSISGQWRWSVILPQLKYAEQLSTMCLKHFGAEGLVYLSVCDCAGLLPPSHLSSSYYCTYGDTIVLLDSSCSNRSPVRVSLKCVIKSFFLPLALPGHHSSRVSVFVCVSRTWQKPFPSRRWWCAEWTPLERTYASWAHQMMPLGFKHSSNSSTHIGLMSVSSSTSGREGACE